MAAAAEASQSRNSMGGINLKQQTINLNDASASSVNYESKETYQLEQPTSYSGYQSSAITSRSCSSADGGSYSSGNECENDSQLAKGNDVLLGNSAFDYITANHVNTLNSATIFDGAKGCKACKNSRSDTVARCFECASYMPLTKQENKEESLVNGVSLVNSVCGANNFNTNLNGDSSKTVAGATEVLLGGINGRADSTPHLLNGSGGGSGVLLDNAWPERLHSTGLTSNSTAATCIGGINPYNIWSDGSNNLLLLSHLTTNTTNLGVNNFVTDSLPDLRSHLLLTPVQNTKSVLKRCMMVYHCKFGEFGVGEGQFTEPSGVAVNAQNYILVADTNNHRLQIFDKEGHFKFQFGECGKRDSQLLYPNRVAVSRATGDIVVTERSPTHQVQVFNQYGQFVRKFGANILQHPRGLTVDNQGNIIVVECKVMRVIIFDQLGNLLQKFGCNKHLKFPNGVAVNDKEEIFISDNRTHCVKVFSYEGRYLRQIGCEGITNYPIGVCISNKGDILIADNHNNFNLTVFTQDGELLGAYESRVKHAQCFDVALTDDGSVVLASKDYRVYLYRYAPVLPPGL